MANRRMIYQDFFEDDFFGTQNHTSRLLWVGLISAMADDQGRMLDNVHLINAKVFIFDPVPPDELHSYLDSFRIANKIVRYESGGKNLIQIINWWKYQTPAWASPSNFDPPQGWVDRVKCHIPGNQRKKKQGGNILNINWDKKGGFSEELHSSLSSDLNDVDDNGDVNDEVNDNEEIKSGQSPHSLALTDENGELAPEEDRIIEIFCDRVGLTGNNRPYENDPSNRKWYADWLREAGEIQKLGISSGEMGEAIAILKASGYSCKHPGAIIETVKNMRKDREAFEKGEKKKLHRYKLEKYTDARGNWNYQPIDWWEEK